MPSTPSQIASTWARSARSAALNFSSLPDRPAPSDRSAPGPDRSAAAACARMCRSRRRRRSSICVAFRSSYLSTDLRSLAGNDSKLKRSGNATTRTANVRRSIALSRLAPGDLLSRSGHPCPRSALREILAEAFGGGAADHRPALGRRAGVVRRRALSAVQRHSEPAHPQVGRGDRRGQHLPQAVELRQRQHPRPAGTARHLRARRPPRHPHRI